MRLNSSHFILPVAVDSVYVQNKNSSDFFVVLGDEYPSLEEERETTHQAALIIGLDSVPIILNLTG